MRRLDRQLSSWLFLRLFEEMVLTYLLGAEVEGISLDGAQYSILTEIVHRSTGVVRGPALQVLPG